MSMTIQEVFDHYNTLNPQVNISRNTPDSLIMTTTYSQFKTICGLTDVKMAEFKRKAFILFDDISKIIQSQNNVIRLGKKDSYFEAYDVMFINLDDNKVKQIYDLFEANGLFEEGFKLLVINFIIENESEPEHLKTMMMKYVPENENEEEFFGYIV